MADSLPTFNLVDEPWIPARFDDGAVADLSIRDAFHNADHVRELGGELPTQTFAIFRLLLAIVYRAVHDHTVPGGWNEDAWESWWREGLPTDDIDDYLNEFHERFELFHPTRPFFQVVDLRTAKDELKDTSGLIFDLPSNNRLFTNRAGALSLRLPFAEAARWLVNAQAFDPSGIKSGAVGDSRVKGGKGYPIGVAWSGLLGGVLIEGDSLRETLLLNLARPSEDDESGRDPRSDIPPWEDEVADTAAEREGLRVSGPVRLYTWQSRRIRLVAADGAVNGVVLSNGDALTPQNQYLHELMSGWRYSEPQTKKHGRVTFMPNEHRAGRAFWRGIGALLPSLPNVAKVDGHDRFLVPQTVEALSRRLNASSALDPSYRLRVRAIGVVYGSNNSVVDDVIDDRVSVALALLHRRNAELAAIATEAVNIAESAVKALRDLAANLARAAGGEGDGARSSAEEIAYAELDPAYRAWLAILDDDTAPVAAAASWKSEVSRIVRRLGNEFIHSAGPVAWVGREVSGFAGSTFVNTSRADVWFRGALHKIVGTALTDLNAKETAA